MVTFQGIQLFQVFLEVKSTPGPPLLRLQMQFTDLVNREISLVELDSWKWDRVAASLMRRAKTALQESKNGLRPAN